MSAGTNRIITPLIVVFILATTAPTFAGQIIYVDDDSHGANDGSSWADAYNYLQDALTDANSALKPVEIQVAEGIYTPDSNSADPGGSGDRMATFQLINGVAIRGGYAGSGAPDPNTRDIELYETILSGDLDGNDIDVNDLDLWYLRYLWDEPSRAENSYNVVTANGTDDTAILEGFTITGGNANGPVYHDERGGGMYNDHSSPTVTNCTFSGNTAISGGGMYNDYYSRPSVTNCTFSSNLVYYEGGGMYNDDCNPSVINCTFSGNTAGSGGGMFNYDCSPWVTNCTFSGNSAGNKGGGMFNHYGGPDVANCTFSGNTATDNGGGMFNDNSSPWVINCILWIDSPDEIDYSGSNPTVTYCDIQGGYPGYGNIDADPCFVDPGFWDVNGVWIDGDYHLLPSSPCINAGSDYAPGETDFDGDLRVIYGRVDIGADEYSNGCFPPCHPDYFEWLAVGEPECWCYPRQCHGDADGQFHGGGKCCKYYVGPGDMNILISAWLVKEPGFGPGIFSIPNGICADFAHDLGGGHKTGYYRVGPTDLNILVANWLVYEYPLGLGVPPDCLD